MKYIILDMEWNQAPCAELTRKLDDGSRFSGEIIQVGAIKMDEKGNIESTFDSLIKPVVYKKMHKKVSRLTGITADMLLDAGSFEECMNEFAEWCEPEHIIFTWGPDDIRVLRQNCRLFEFEEGFFENWYNLQVIYNMQTGTGSGQQALAAAVEHFSIDSSLKAHDALNDAFYTAEVLRCLDIEKGIAEYGKGNLTPPPDEKRKKIFTGIKGRAAMVKDPEICSVLCPECGEEMTASPEGYVKVSHFKFVGRYTCSEHGEYAVTLKIGGGSDKNITVRRTVKKYVPEPEIAEEEPEEPNVPEAAAELPAEA